MKYFGYAQKKRLCPLQDSKNPQNLLKPYHCPPSFASFLVKSPQTLLLTRGYSKLPRSPSSLKEFTVLEVPYSKVMATGSSSSTHYEAKTLELLENARFSPTRLGDRDGSIDGSRVEWRGSKLNCSRYPMTVPIVHSCNWSRNIIVPCKWVSRFYSVLFYIAPGVKYASISCAITYQYFNCVRAKSALRCNNDFSTVATPSRWRVTISFVVGLLIEYQI